MVMIKFYNYHIKFLLLTMLEGPASDVWKL
jgi:hypothetical protein